MLEPLAVHDTAPRPDWLRCLWLCLPALIIGAALRIAVLIALPDGYYGPDSNSYYDTTSSLWLDGQWDLGPKRRWVYPLLLIPTPLLPGREVVAIAVVQHVLGLVTVFGIGWIVMHLTRRPAIWVPLVTTMAAMWPRMIWYEHEIVAESVLLAGIVLAIALAYPTHRLREPRRLLWFLLAVALIVAIKPHGRPIWLGLMISAVLLAGPPWRWARGSFVAVGISMAIILTTGSSKQGPWLLLSSALPLVDPDHGKWPEYRQILRPHIEEARADLSQYPWNQSRYKRMLIEGPDKGTLGPQWQEMLQERKKTKFLRVARDLAVDAIVHAPFTYAGMVLRKIGMVLSDENAGYNLAPRVFWRDQLSDNVERWPLHSDQLKFLYGMDEAALLAYASERSSRREWYEPYVYHFTHAFAWMRTVNTGTRTLHPAWFGLLALFGFLTCLRPGRWRETAPLWLSLGFFLAIIFGVGDSVVRYLQPVEWIGLIFVALGLDWVLQFIWPGARPTPKAGGSSQSRDGQSGTSQRDLEVPPTLRLWE